MRKVVAAIFMLSVCTSLAAAQAPTSGNIFFGYSYLNTDVSSPGRSNINGWESSLEGKMIPHLGIVADFSGHYGSGMFVIGCPTVNANVSLYNVAFGPRVSVSIGRFRPFGEALVGVAHVSASQAGGDTSLGSAFGGGLDYRLAHLIAWRVQADYVHTSFFSASQNNVRGSTGIVLRF